MGVSDPDPEDVAPGDVTELSRRNKEAEDVTLMSARVRSTLPSENDEFTLLSSRHLSEEETADATRLSRRPHDPPPASVGGSSKLAALPPGAIGGAVVERGSFGHPPEAYVPRSAPPASVPEVEPANPVPADVGVADASHSRSRREAARHRRLILAAVIFAATAAAMTAAVLGIVALVTGQD